MHICLGSFPHLKELAIINETRGNVLDILGNPNGTLVPHENTLDYYYGTKPRKASILWPTLTTLTLAGNPVEKFNFRHLVSILVYRRYNGFPIERLRVLGAKVDSGLVKKLAAVVDAFELREDKIHYSRFMDDVLEGM
jgi:hypothetical protein